MKKTFLTVAIAAVMAAIFAPAALAQKADKGRFDKEAVMEKLRAEKVALITNELELTPEEAQVFWPIYNQAQAEKREALGNVRKLYREMNAASKDGRSEKEVEKLVKQYVEANSKASEIDAKYAPKFLKVLPAAKVAKLYSAEEKFRKLQFQNFQHWGDRGKGGPGMRKNGRPGAPGVKPGEGFPKDGAKCDKCPDGKCKDGAKCDKCPDGKCKDGAKCDKCPDGKCNDGAKCDKCPDGKCKDGAKCDKCPDGKCKDGGKCDKCPKEKPVETPKTM